MGMLPSDKYLAHLIGVTEEEFREFQEYIKAEYAKAPAPAVVCGTATIIAVAQLVIGTGLLIAGELLRPKATRPKTPGEAKLKEVEGKQIVQNTDFTPRYGFSGTQGVTTLGSTIPVVYANAEEDADPNVLNYGGVRVNMPLLWSQTLSLYGSQMFRGVFLLSEGEIDRVDEDNYAIGSTLLDNFFFGSTNSVANTEGARATIYLSKDGGRIQNEDRVLGRSADNDPGNSGGSAVGNVYNITWNASLGDGIQTDFCASYVPNNQTTFGVYSPIGNHLVYKVNPQMAPGVRQVTENNTADERLEFFCPCDGASMNKRDKYRCKFVTYSGITSRGRTSFGASLNRVEADGSLRYFEVDDEIEYTLFAESDKDVVFDDWEDDGDFADEEANDGTGAECQDVAQVVAGMQSTWDDALIVGEKYRIGTALAVCIERTSERFVSEAENINLPDGDPDLRQVDAKFRVVERGAVSTFNANILKNTSSTYKDETDRGTAFNITGTGGIQRNDSAFPDASLQDAFIGGHILRYAEGFISSSRPVNAIELSIRSAVGIQVQGLMNFQSAGIYKEYDEKFCTPYRNEDPTKIANIRFASDTITAAVDRYSFFEVHYQIEKDAWRQFDFLIGTKGETSQNQFNYIRLELYDASGNTVRRQVNIKLKPLSGFEVRQRYETQSPVQPLYILNSNSETYFIKADTGAAGDDRATLVFHGEEIDPSRDKFMFNLGRSLYKDTDDGAVYRLQTSYQYNWKRGENEVELYGLPKNDKNSHVDDGGKLAEIFGFRQISTTAQSGPEHEVVAVNEIVDNRLENGVDFTPQYDNMALVGLNIQSSDEFSQLPQFSAYVERGRIVRKINRGGDINRDGPTNLFPEILFDLLTDSRYGAGKYVVDSMIDLESFYEAKQFCKSRTYRFDGAITEPINLRTWAADHANMHLLQFGEKEGKFFLRQAFQFDAAPIVSSFSAGNIVEGSFEYQYLNPEEREPIQVSVTYREERKNPATDQARFPVTREVLVREKGYGGNPQTEQLDMSAFCTNRQHAIDAAKYMIRTRRLTDHIIKFKTTHEAVLTEMYPGDYIQVHLESTACSSTRNGIVQADGTVVSATPLDPGTYDVIGWLGDPAVEPAPMQLVVDADGKGNLPGLIFTIPLALTESQTYLIERIASEQDGSFSIEASVAPTVANGVLELADGFDDDNNWDIRP